MTIPVRQREFLKAKARFNSAKLGFNVDLVGTVIKNNKQTCAIKCTIGNPVWQRKHENKNPEGVPCFHKCPFALWYER